LIDAKSSKSFFCLALVPKLTGSIIDKYLMHTYQASVRAKMNGHSQVIKTEVRAMNAQDARWLLWAQYGFHSIQSGPSQVNTR
jgi:hypothetical protein